MLTFWRCADARTARTPRAAWSARRDEGGPAAGNRAGGRCVEMLRAAVPGTTTEPRSSDKRGTGRILFSCLPR
jgi:hypothetical protein